jgi:hypothetical protein
VLLHMEVLQRITAVVLSPIPDLEDNVLGSIR